MKHGEKFYFIYAWCYLDLVTTLIRSRIHSKKLRPNTWTTLSTKKLKKRYGRIGTGDRPWLYLLIREDLVTWQVLMQYTHQVKKDERRADYKLKDERWAEGFRLSEIALPRALQPATPALVKATGVHGKLQAIVNKSLSIDCGAALAFCDWALGTSMKLKDKTID